MANYWVVADVSSPIYNIYQRNCFPRSATFRTETSTAKLFKKAAKEVALGNVCGVFFFETFMHSGKVT